MLSIGKMSRISQTTVKTLRYYDQIGLLKPAYIDEQNGFRYYEIGQIDTLVLISRYKRYGFSLEEIMALMKMSDKETVDKLKQQHQKLSRQILELQTSLQDIKVLIDRKERKPHNMNQNKVAIVTPEEKPVLSLRQEMGVGDFGKYFGMLFEKVAKEKIPSSMITGARYYDEEFNPEKSDIEVFVTLHDFTKANGKIGGVPCAMLVHKGSYSTLGETYGEIEKWMQENGYELAGAPYEIYSKTGYQNPDPATWETEVYFPVKKC